MVNCACDDGGDDDGRDFGDDDDGGGDKGEWRVARPVDLSICPDISKVTLNPSCHYHDDKKMKMEIIDILVTFDLAFSTLTPEISF